MAIHKGIIIHQYLDHWLVKATSHRGCLRHTLDLVKICQSLGYQFDLMAGRVRPIPDHWQNLQDKYYKYCHYRFVRSCSSCLIGLLTATGMQFHLGQLHRRPIQWHLKNNWRVPESLEKVIPIPRCCTYIYKGGCKRTMSLQANHYTQIKHDQQILQIHQKQGGVLT